MWANAIKVWAYAIKVWAKVIKVWANAIKVWAKAIKVWANAIKIRDQHKKIVGHSYALNSSKNEFELLSNAYICFCCITATFEKCQMPFWNHNLAPRFKAAHSHK